MTPHYQPDDYYPIEKAPAEQDRDKRQSCNA